MSGSILARGLGVRFQFDRQSRPVTPALARVRGHVTTSWGLRDVDLAIGPGEAVALVGHNGAGKTTLLRVLADVYGPDAGTLAVRGRIGTLLSVEGGLMPSLTGRENAALLGLLAGLSRAQARASLDRLKAGSGLADAFEHPVSSYSQGMRARLGFAVIEQAAPEVLLLDEVHEALDHDFRERVEAAVRRVRRAGGVVVAAGHDHAVLQRLCDRAVELEHGRVKADGPFERVVRLAS